MYPNVFVVLRWVIDAIIDYVFRQVVGPFSGIINDGVQVDIEVDKADFWGDGVDVVDEFIATDCQANAVCFSTGELDVADKVGKGYFLSLWMVFLETKKIVLVLSMCLERRRNLPPPCAMRKNSFAVEISQVVFSGPDWRVWR